MTAFIDWFAFWVICVFLVSAGFIASVIIIALLFVVGSRLCGYGGHDDF
jgi:hypothetical protein